MVVTSDTIYHFETLNSPPFSQSTGFSGMQTIKRVRDSIFIIVGDNGLILRTTEYGKSWVPYALEDSLKKHQLKGAVFVNDSVGYVTGYYILKTTDAGESWTLVLHYSWNHISGNHLGANFVTDISILKNGSALLVGHTYGAYFVFSPSFDKIENDNVFSGAVNCWFIDFQESHGIAGGYYALYETFDSGVNWTKIPEIEDLKDGQFVDGNCAYAVGLQGKVIAMEGCFRNTSIELPVYHKRIKQLKNQKDVLGRNASESKYIKINNQ